MHECINSYCVPKSKKFNKNFLLTNFILSTEDEFSIESLYKKAKKINISVSKEKIKRAVFRLRDNYYLDEKGSKYTVISEKIAKRW